VPSPLPPPRIFNKSENKSVIEENKNVIEREIRKILVKMMKNFLYTLKLLIIFTIQQSLLKPDTHANNI